MTLTLEEQRLDRYPELIRLLEEQERLQRRSLGAEHRDQGETLMRLANARRHLGDLGTAEADFEQALRILIAQAGADAPVAHLARLVGAEIYASRGQRDRAESIALRVINGLPKENPVALVPALARIRCAEERVAEGLELLDRAALQIASLEPWRRASVDAERAACPSSKPAKGLRAQRSSGFKLCWPRRRVGRLG